METLSQPMTDAAYEYNKSLSDVREFVSGIAEDARAEYDEKSERWQACERGQDAGRWLEQWEATELENFEFEPPDPLDEIDPSKIGGTLEDLPETVASD
jgi:hypothetical protein